LFNQELMRLEIIQNLEKLSKMKKNIGIILTVAAVGIGGYLLFQAWQKNKIDETPVSYDEAIKKLEKAKKDS